VRHILNPNRARWPKDLELLSLDIRDDPTNTRPRFYLAQTLECLGRYAGAQEAYETRIEMGGWPEEVYESKFRRARAMDMQRHESWAEVQQAYLDAHAFDPRRAEPLFAIAERWYAERNYSLCYLFAHRAASMPTPETRLFLDVEVYAWKAADLVAICAYYLATQANDQQLRAIGKQHAGFALAAHPADERLFANLKAYG
jgi:hypothetical protein